MSAEPTAVEESKKENDQKMMNINFRMERRDSQNEKQGSYNTAPQFQANNGGIDSEKEGGMPNSIHSQ